jgi:gamma-glutamyltranspeptidase/glutathione hydrolase
MPRLGWDAVTVPGQVAAWADLHERFGTLPFADLLAPAIRYAEEGFVVSPITSRAWARGPGLFADFPDFKDHFLQDGKAPDPGHVFRSPATARTLARIAETKGEDFYRGGLAERMAATAREAGAVLTAEDLANHRSTWVTPLAVDFAEVELHELPPNGQGLAALVALGVLDRCAWQDFAPDGADALHLQIEAMKLGLRDAYAEVADPDSLRVNPEGLLESARLDALAAGVRLDRAAPVEGRLRPDGGTVYLTAADDAGRMVSFIQSNYFGFGSGVVIPGTGIALQSRGMGFSLDEGHPNRVGGGKRPFHTIIPGFVTRDGEPVLSFGVMGGNMQPQGHVQVAARIFGYGQNPQAATDAPRWYLHEDFRLALERGVPGAVAEELASRGHRVDPVEPRASFGGAQLVLRLEDGYCAASDHRKDGQAVGY